MSTTYQQTKIGKRAEQDAAPFEAWGGFLGRLSDQLWGADDTVDVAGQVGRQASKAHAAAADIYLAAERAMAELEAERCDHLGEVVESVAHGYLGDAPAGTLQQLCVDCGAVLRSTAPADVDVDDLPPHLARDFDAVVAAR